MRISFVGELGYELHIPIESCEKVFQGLTEYGKPWNLKHAGYRALYSLSSEKGTLKHCYRFTRYEKKNFRV